jgi:hypothetical protein
MITFADIKASWRSIALVAVVIVIAVLVSCWQTADLTSLR